MRLTSFLAGILLLSIAPASALAERTTKAPAAPLPRSSKAAHVTKRPASRRGAAEPKGAKRWQRARSPVLEVLQHMDRVVKTTSYVHATHIDEAAGRFDFDCSAMAAWVLSRATPLAEQTVLTRNGVGRPVAANYHDVIAQSPEDHAAAGWQRIARIEDVRPGDVLAWRRPPSVQSTNTGHVAFVVGTPKRIAPGRNYFELRVADSSSVLHADDSRAAPRRSGFGYGTMSFGIDPKTHRALSYGWMGGSTVWYPKTPIEFGRPVR